MAKLPELCEIQYGYAFDSACFTENNTYLPLVRIRDVKRGYSETFYSGNYPSDYVIDSGSLLVGMDGEFNIARWKGGHALLNQRVCKITAKENVNEEYIRFALSKALKEIENRTSFVTVKHLSAKELNQLEIDIPNYTTQTEVAKVLTQIESIISARQRQLQKLDELVKARFIELFVATDEASDWPYCTIADVSNDMRTGPFGSALHHDEFVDSGVFVLGIDNAVENKFSYNRMRYITAEKYQALKRYTVYPGDVIITIMGTVGRSAVIPADMPKAINTKHLACITPNVKMVNAQFLSCAFQVHPDIRAQLQKQCKGAIMDGLNLTIIKGLSFHIPPINLQDWFVGFYEQVDKSKVAVQKALDEAQLLFDSLMQKYFG